MRKIFLAVLFGIGIMSCKKEVLKTQSLPVTVNKPPVAKAGADQIITLPTVSVILNGNASYDVDGNIILYSWTKISGPPSFDIINPDSSKTTVSQLAQGVYQFELCVKDNKGLSAKDTIQITVNEPPPSLPPPPPPPPTPIPDSLGRVTFWTYLAVGDDRQASIINIAIDNQNKIITHYGGAPSACTDRIPHLTDGQFDLVPGVYNWKATYYQYSVSGTITINRGVCVLQEIIF